MMSYDASSSTTRVSQGYDVFLTFRGEDTRTGFTSHLYEALTRKRIRTYKDDKSLEIGNFIAPGGYRSFKICHSNFIQQFCNIEMVFGGDHKGFANHEVDSEITPQKVATWRSALAKVGAIKGLHVTPHRNESEIVSEILRRILQDLQDASPVDLSLLTKELKDEEALRLFCQSAFGDGHPTHGYEKLSDDIVKFAGGLPIALTVYGSLLCGKEEKYWIEILKKVQEYPHKEVLGRLEVGYAKLDRDQQHTFMYITCFLKGRDIDLESRTIEIINQEPYKVEVEDCIDDPSCISNMRKLKFLRISNIHFPQGLNYLSNDLRILEWYGCSLKSLPYVFEPKHIYELEMCYSQLETLWEKNLDLPNFRSIDLSFSMDLTKIPDLTSTPNLVKLNLKGCTKLKELHQSVLSHKRLQFINLIGCTRLQSLGRSNMEMEALVTLLLSGCSNLEYIPEFGHNMKCLEHLYVDGTNIKKLPGSLGELCNLRKLDASETSIQEIPLSVHYLKRLRHLRIHRCPISSQSRGFLFSKMDMLFGLRELDLSYCNLSAVPDCIGLLHRLVSLDLSGNDFASLPRNICLLSNLRVLCLDNCKRLQSLPKLSVLRSKYKTTPEAVFEIVGAGSVIPLGFKQLRSDESLSLQGPWIGVVICTVVALHHIDAAVETKYVVTAHVHVGEKHWRIPVPINFLAAGLENQLVFYWTRAEDLHRIVDSSYKNNFKFSFSMEPRDASDSWLSVKLALEQIVAKSRTENDYSYKEMLKQLNDLEAAKDIRFCDNFITSFAFVFMRTVALSRHLNRFKTLKSASQ
ncbi:hypothetical protein L1987_59139 [Smallanthus sonchifolius]|uniref:Uncharacterized protein n=1 Tax=Smallanthus sonchifolius TaxID=185202 RepID=A0ACB9D4M3_9ASTR|nr:hypothetical protein L1987_59139 [Smallanthus sonchifolius]